MKQNPKTVRMWMIICLLFSSGLATLENDRDFKMCGIWRHGNTSRNLKYDLKTGCEKIEISANESTLSIRGRITAKCTRSSSIDLDSNALQNQSNFCVFWEPLLDLLIVEVNGKNHTLCEPKGLQGSCCTDLSLGDQKNASVYGIVKGSIHGDIIRDDAMERYTFEGDSINCKEKFCDEASSQKSRGANMIEEVVMKSGTTGHVDLPCAQSTVIEMEEGFTGLNLTLPAHPSVDPNMIPSVYLPSCLKSATKIKSKVVCTYYKEQKLFQRGPSDSTLLDDIVGLSVENEIIKNLSEPVKIRFHHIPLPANCSGRCVSWDTRTDKEMIWRYDGCNTLKINERETECHCDHFTYFAILVQVEQKATVRHLEALTFITAVGCAVSIVSCLVLFYWLCKLRKGKKNQTSLVHRGLVVAIFFLCLFFILTGTIANVGNPTVCKITGSLLHYSLLSTLCWMAMEVFHTFLLVRKVFSSTPPWVFYVGGFGLPALLVGILFSIGDIYGEKKIVPSENITSPYRMCWMLDTEKSLLAHYIINVGLLAVVVSSGTVMLFLVVKEIRNRPDWKKIHVAFLSIWGLTCLFGTTWGLGFLNFGPFSEATIFLFCIINSLQGFFLMLRYYSLERIKKKDDSSSDGSSSGSSKQHMLHTHENS